MVKWTKIFATAFVLTLVLSCNKKNNNQNVQANCTVQKAMSVPVNFTILNGSGQFFPLTSPGGYIYVNNVGVNGILIYRINNNQFVAFERSCTQDGCNSTKARVWVQTGNTSLKDSVCGSQFSILDGSVQTAPATIALYQYHTNWDGNQLHVYN